MWERVVERWETTSALTRDHGITRHSDNGVTNKYHYYIIYRVDYLSGSRPRRRPRGNGIDRIEERIASITGESRKETTESRLVSKPTDIEIVPANAVK